MRHSPHAMAAAALACACGAGARDLAPRPEPAAVARPAGCRAVLPGTPLQPLLDELPAGGALCLAAGSYRGPIAIGAHATVWGPSGEAAVITAGARGSTVRLVGAGARLVGVLVDGSGGDYQESDAAVRVAADDAAVVGVTVRRALFGILVDRARRVEIRGNVVYGVGGEALGLRGDGIRLWETQDSLVEDNRVSDARDVVVWYSSGNRVVGNEVVRSRYGTHLMYSHDNLIANNRYDHDVVGVFVMYSHDVTLVRNLIAGAGGAAGIGIGLKDSGRIRVAGNAFVRDAVGLYVDHSPQRLGDVDVIEGNAFRLCDRAVLFHATEQHNRFLGNDFTGNQAQLAVDGGGDGLSVEWDGNHFDDYAGYDLDGDGVGDVPYELRSLSGQLVDDHPDAAFFHGTPVLTLADAASHLMPLFAPRLLLRDPHPRMSAIQPEIPSHVR